MMYAPKLSDEISTIGAPAVSEPLFIDWPRVVYI